MMIKIYCLADPRNDKPFYVGATNGKLSVRLSSHITTAFDYVMHPPFMNNTISAKKHRLIFDIITNGFRPLIIELQTIDRLQANHFEEFYYRMFMGRGFEMYQVEHGFKYIEARTNSRFTKMVTDRRLVKYSKNVDNFY